MSIERRSQLVIALLLLSGTEAAQAQAVAAPQRTPDQLAAGKQPAAPTAPAPAKPASIRAEQLATARAKLAGDEAAIRQALASLGELADDAAAEAVVARLRRGLPPQLSEAAIDTLVLINRPKLAGPALLELAQHRRMQVRIKAMDALSALKIRSAQSALLYALDDPSEEVRGAAMRALAHVGNARALPAMSAAAERGVPGGWEAVGQLATAADLEPLLMRARVGDVIAIRPALNVIVARSDFPLEGKLRAIRQLEALDSASARAALGDWLEAYKASGHPRLRRALLESVQRIEKAKLAAKSAEPAPVKPGAGPPPPKPSAAVRPGAPAGSAPPPSAAAPRGPAANGGAELAQSAEVAR